MYYSGVEDFAQLKEFNGFELPYQRNQHFIYYVCQLFSKRDGYGNYNGFGWIFSDEFVVLLIDLIETQIVITQREAKRLIKSCGHEMGHNP